MKCTLLIGRKKMEDENSITGMLMRYLSRLYQPEPYPAIKAFFLLAIFAA
jgi:hypothetical protein